MAEGETIRIEKRGHPVAFLSPYDSTADGLPRQKPDARARSKDIWGHRCFSAVEATAMREYKLEGEEG